MRNAIRYAPRASVTASKLFPEASFTALIVTPGSTAAVESITVPLTVASCAYPTRGIARIAQTKINRLVTLDVMDTSGPFFGTLYTRTPSRERFQRDRKSTRL